MALRDGQYKEAEYWNQKNQ